MTVWYLERTEPSRPGDISKTASAMCRPALAMWSVYINNILINNGAWLFDFDRDTLRIEINKSDIGDDGSLALIALDDKRTRLDEYAVQLEQFKIQNTSTIWPVLMLILIGIGLLGATVATVYLIMKKRNRA